LLAEDSFEFLLTRVGVSETPTFYKHNKQQYPTCPDLASPMPAILRRKFKHSYVLYRST
jgi:hypothetical protein